MSNKQTHNQSRPDSYALGLSLYRQGRFSEAVEALAPAVASSDVLGRMAGYYRAMSWRAMGLEAMNQGRFDEAGCHLRDALGVLGDNAELSSYLVRLYARSRRYADCAVQQERVRDGRPGDERAWKDLAQTQWQAGQRAGAYMTLADALRRFPKAASLHMQMGLFLGAEERFAESREHFKLAVDADCTHCEAHRLLGLAAAAAGDSLAAVQSLQRAFELRPSDLALAYQVSLACDVARKAGHDLTLRLPDVAAPTEGSQLGQLAAYVADEPDFLDACLSLPASTQDGELFEMLDGVAEVAAHRHPNYADLHYHGSRIAERTGKLESAIGRARTALRINPKYIKARVHLGGLYVRAGLGTEAVACLRQAVTSGADWPDVHCQIGELLARGGQAAEAREHFTRALQLNGRFDRAEAGLAALAA